jgi:hypothetical protein
MPSLELVYDADCPNVDDTRARIRAALHAAGLREHWKEWDCADPAAPTHVRAWGSPTVLVDGRDVAGMLPAQAATCRLYINGQGRNQGVPPTEMIVAALTSATAQRRTAQHGFRLTAVLPAIGVAALPKLTCPACWPAYAGLMSALGFGFIDYTPYLMPLMLGFLAVTLATLAWRAGARRGYGPLWLGLASSGIVLTGKFVFDSEGAIWAGIALLVAASLWNSWPRQTASKYPACDKV